MARARKRAKPRTERKPKKQDTRRKRPARRVVPGTSIQRSVAAAARLIEPPAADIGRPTVESAPSAEPERSSRRVAETALLSLARDVHRIHVADDEPAGHLRAALARLASAYTDGTLPRAMFHAWLHRGGDERATLALGWAREQVRLALEELLQDEVGRGRARRDIAAATLAWLLLAGCEALAHEPSGSIEERVDMLATLVSSGDAAR
jgi:hypothetical protein